MEEPPISVRQVVVAGAAFVSLIVVGTIGYMLILSESVVDALIRTVSTVYTAGLIPAPDSTAGKIFTLVLVVWGVAIFVYVFGLVIELVVRGTVTGAWQKRRTRRRVESLSDHYIICGYGRVGRRVAEEFRGSGTRYVVLDFSPQAIAAAREHGDLFIEGNGTEDEDLRAAGLERARGLVAASDDDADNLYISLSARNARPDLMIVARASDEDAERKLKLAGADRVVTPYATAGKTMANLVLKPQVSAFLDAMTTGSGPDLTFEEIVVTEACRQAGKSISELNIRRETGALIVALRKRDGTFDTTPTPEARMDVGDVLIAAGTPEELRALEELFAPREPVAAS